MTDLRFERRQGADVDRACAGRARRGAGSDAGGRQAAALASPGFAGCRPRQRMAGGIALLCNAAVDRRGRGGPRGGAAGIGLPRTEIAFLQATAWPTEQEHRAAPRATARAARRPSRPCGHSTSGLTRRPVPRTRGGTRARADARASRRARRSATGGGCRRGNAVAAAAAARGDGAAACPYRPLAASHHAGRASLVLLGAMIETPTAARRAKEEIALEVDFLSIGTNDLVASTLTLRRELPPRLRRRPIPPSSHMSRPWSRPRTRSASLSRSAARRPVSRSSWRSSSVSASTSSASRRHASTWFGVVRALSAESAAVLAGQALQAGSAEAVPSSCAQVRPATSSARRSRASTASAPEAEISSWVPPVAPRASTRMLLAFAPRPFASTRISRRLRPPRGRTPLRGERAARRAPAAARGRRARACRHSKPPRRP